MRGPVHTWQAGRYPTWTSDTRDDCFAMALQPGANPTVSLGRNLPRGNPGGPFCQSLHRDSKLFPANNVRKTSWCGYSTHLLSVLDAEYMRVSLPGLLTPRASDVGPARE